MCVCVCVFVYILTSGPSSCSAREGRGEAVVPSCVSVSALSVCDLRGQPCMYVVYTCALVLVSAGNTSPDSPLLGPGGIERQQLHLSWTVGSSTIYLPQKARMQIGSKNP